MPGKNPSLMETLLRFERAHMRQSVDEMRACFHEEALIESVASEGRALGADETIAALRAAFDDGIYSIGDWSYEEITPEIIVSRTSTRHRLSGDQGGVSNEAVYRVTTGRDGLMWRVKLFRKRAEAAAELKRQGHYLRI